MDRPNTKLLSQLPSVDELLKSSAGQGWLAAFPRTLVVRAIRDTLDEIRKAILGGAQAHTSADALSDEIFRRLRELSSYSLVPVINATGIVLHTNLGRALLSERALENVMNAGGSYTNLEYDLPAGARGKRHTHTGRLLREITGAEDAFVVNNNAAAVLLSLTALARGREVIVSRGELVEIGGSFRIPDVMQASGAILREVGTTNKTHAYDYERAMNENTALILKVHQSNYRVIGFTEEVGVRELAAIGRQHGIPVMYDLGSGCLVDLKPYGIHSEPTVREVVDSGADLVTFSGDKLLGGPQGGVIAGKKAYLQLLRKHPVARALRVDKLTIAALEATLMDYLDPDRARQKIPVLSLLFQPLEDIKTRARSIAAKLRKSVSASAVKIEVREDVSMAGGGSLPEAVFSTFVVAVSPSELSVNELEGRLRRGSPPLISRISENTLLLDARTIRDKEAAVVVQLVSSALQG